MNILPEFLKIKKVPSVEWSSNQPLNFTPRIKTLLFFNSWTYIFWFWRISFNPLHNRS